MSEPEKKGSPWPWILVPVAAVSMFFVLRQCRQSIPPAERAPETAAVESTTAAPAVMVLPAAESGAAPASTPAPQ
jgi:hypothetical protein